MYVHDRVFSLTFSFKSNWVIFFQIRFFCRGESLSNLWTLPFHDFSCWFISSSVFSVTREKSVIYVFSSMLVLIEFVKKGCCWSSLILMACLSSFCSVFVCFFWLPFGFVSIVVEGELLICVFLLCLNMDFNAYFLEVVSDQGKVQNCLIYIYVKTSVLIEFNPEYQ